MKKWFIRSVNVLLILAVVGSAAAYLIDRHVRLFAAQKLQTSITEIPVEEPPRIAIVFGAKVRPNEELTNALYDRVLTAAELYKSGRVKKLLMSGDNPNEGYDEPTAMKNAAVKMGVPETDIVMDFAGRRTYDTCYRAREIFEVKRAILVTQEFHQPRALYLCNSMGVDSIGITANRRTYDGERYWAFREFFSVISAWFEMNFVPFTPVGGEKEPITQ